MTLKEKNNVLSLEKQIEDRDREITMPNHDLLIWEEEFARVVRTHKRGVFKRSEDLLCGVTCKRK